MILFRIEQRGSKWVVLPENGDKVLGTHDTKEEAEKQLAAIEASKHAHEVTFEAVRGPDGKVRECVWDRICVPGQDEKDGQHTEFTLSTLSQMVDNFLDRGDPIPIDFNHQSNYAHLNGQPAPALGFYCALAIVAKGQIVRLGCLPGYENTTGQEPGLDLTRDGLYGYRSEVTELGQELLPNFKLLSPTFTPQGTKRDGTPVGYMLYAVAATNTPWQSGTSITFAQEPVGAAPTQQQERKPMARFAKLAKFAGLEEGADDAAIKQALANKMAALAKQAMEDETMKYEDEAQKLEEAASEMEEESYEGEEPVVMKKMAAKFKKMAKLAKMEEAEPFAGKETPEEEAAEEKAIAKAMKEEKMEEDDKAEAKMAAMQATLVAMQSKLSKFEKAEAAREQAAERERQARIDALADQAVAGGYPKEQRGALVKFARADFEAARSTVAHLLPKSSAPAHLFDRMSAMGAPIGKSREDRESSASANKTRSVKNAFGTFVEVDHAFATEVKRQAESNDPVLMAKVDKYLTPAERPSMFHRLLAAEKIVRAERPDLADE